MSLKKEISWRIEYVLYIAAERCLSILPITLTAHFSYWLGDLFFFFSRRYRRIVQKNLRIVFAGEKSSDEIHRLSREVFRRSAANLICSTRTARMSASQLDQTVKIEGFELFQKELNKGRGVIAILAHMGNWEALAQKFPHLTEPKYHSGTVYRPLNNPFLNQRVENTRRRRGLHIFSRKSTAFHMAKFVQAGNALGVLCDQRAGNAGEILPFFNHLVSCTPLPRILARNGAGVVGLSIKTTHPGHWCIKVHPLEEPPSTAACMRLLETIIKESPTDVFWLQDRWRMEKNHPLKLNGKNPVDVIIPNGLNLRRCLIWLNNIPVSQPTQPEAIPNDISIEYAIPEGPLPAWIKGKKVHRYKILPHSSRTIRKEILAIDEKDALPLENIFTPTPPSEALKKACHQEKIPLVNA